MHSKTTIGSMIMLGVGLVTTCIGVTALSKANKIAKNTKKAIDSITNDLASKTVVEIREDICEAAAEKAADKAAEKAIKLIRQDINSRIYTAVTNRYEDMEKEMSVKLSEKISETINIDKMSIKIEKRCIEEITGIFMDSLSDYLNPIASHVVRKSLGKETTNEK